MAPRDANNPALAATPLARVMREFEELVSTFEASLLLSGDDSPEHRQTVRRDACRLAISDLRSRYTRKHISRSLRAVESEGKRLEEALGALSLTDNTCANASANDLSSLHNGYFRLYSTELFDLLGQPTELRFGTLRFHTLTSDWSPPHTSPHTPESPWVNVELALNSSFFIADSLETQQHFHTFQLPASPSLQNRGLLSRKPDDLGAFPAFDSWLLFTFLGNGCIKLEVPIEMCADVYGGQLQGRENEEVTFWGDFVDDDDVE